jgi:hypothetical protein
VPITIIERDGVCSISAGGKITVKGCSGEIISSVAARSFVEPEVHKLAANSLLDTSDS